MAITLVAAAGALLAYGAALPHPGVSVDSGEYLAVAQGLTQNRGLTMPYVNYDEPWQVVEPSERVTMAQFPPLYPSLVAAVHGPTNLSLTATARVLGVLAFFATLLAAQSLLWRHSGRWLWALLAGALLIAPDLVTVHAMAWSEPLMLLALVGLVSCVVRYLESARVGWLVAAGLCGATATLARFAGIAFVVGAGLVIATSAGERGKQRLRAAGFTVAALLPIAGWFVRNALVVGTASEKSPGIYPPSLDDAEQLLETIGGWLVPGDPVGLIFGALVVVVAFWLGPKVLRRLVRSDADPLARTCVVIGLAYLSFVVASKLMLDRNIPFDPRILAPLQVLIVLGACSALARARHIRPVAIALLCGLVLLTVYRAGYTSWEFSSLNVTSYTNDHWRKSPTLRYAGNLPEETMLISNAPDPIWLWHQPRTAHLIPSRVNLYSGRRNMRYRKQVTALLEATRCRDALVVFFSKPTRKPPREVDKEVRAQLGLQEIEDFRDGEIYEVAEPPCP